MREEEWSELFLNHISKRSLDCLVDIYVKEGYVKKDSAAEICFGGALRIVDAVEFVVRSAVEGKISFKQAILEIPGIMGDCMDYGTDELNDALDAYEATSDAKKLRQAKTKLKSVEGVGVDE